MLETYAAFDEAMRNAESSIDPPAPVLGYSRESVRRRLRQAIATHLFNPFLRGSTRRFQSGDSAFPIEGETWRLSGLSFRNGSYSFQPRLYLRLFFQFCARWMQVFFRCSWSSEKRTERRLPSTMLFGALEAGESAADADFFDYCRKGPITSLSRARRLIVQSFRRRTGEAPEGIVLTVSPLIHLFLEQWSLRLSMRFLRHHFAALYSYLIAIVRYPITAFLWDDFAFHAVAKTLNDEREIENVVITNSNYASQPLWMTNLAGKQFESHMLWYSANNSPFTFKHSAEPVDFPLFRNISVDVMWVWDKTQAETLKKMGVQADMRIAGPILWSLPALSKPPEDGAFHIALFDVTPFTPEWERSTGYPFYYYNTGNMLVFIDMVVRVSNDVARDLDTRVRIIYKAKRWPAPVHDKRYLDRIKAMSETGGDFSSVPPETNLFTLVSSCHAAICIPFTSPAIVADGLGVPAIYFDPSLDLAPRKQGGVSFASGADELRSILKRLMASRRR